MRVLKQKQGFTLIEVIMVLAISSALAVALLAGYSTTQRRARFTDAIERVVAELNQVKSEVNASYTTGEGNDKTKIFFAKAVEFTEGTGQLTVHTITGANSETISNLTNEGQTTSQLPWGTVVENYDDRNAIVFARNPADGLLNTYAVTSSEFLTPGEYDQAADTAVVTLTFIDGSENYTANVIVDARTGDITTEYLN